MTTALAELDSKILKKLEENHDKGYRALDLIEELNDSYSESDVQRSLAALLSAKRVTLNSKRRLLIEDDQTA